MVLGMEREIDGDKMKFVITDNFDASCWVGTPQNIRISGPLDINQFVIGKVISKVYLYL